MILNSLYVIARFHSRARVSHCALIEGREGTTGTHLGGRAAMLLSTGKRHLRLNVLESHVRLRLELAAVPAPRELTDYRSIAWKDRNRLGGHRQQVGLPVDLHVSVEHAEVILSRPHSSKGCSRPPEQWPAHAPSPCSHKRIHPSRPGLRGGCGGGPRDQCLWERSS